ncbi:MAG TPA: phosphate ABC transporter permease subunit PstC, partial [Acidobacteriaceae bacterium]|nr:phosphate ABC transporter permease subunit PstC [Acidobacteriaceae bacterium]
MTPPSMSLDEEPKITRPLTTPAVMHFVAAAEPAGPEGPASPIRSFLRGRGSGAMADKAFATVMLLCALSIFAIVVFILWILIVRSKLSLSQFGFRFFVHSAWDPVSGDFGALPFIFGTLATSLLALAMGVAIFLTELCPAKLRAPISFVTELLAAIPSVVYGLWAVFVLVPLMRDTMGPW